MSLKHWKSEFWVGWVALLDEVDKRFESVDVRFNEIDNHFVNSRCSFRAYG